jgi:hypothetical protein
VVVTVGAPLIVRMAIISVTLTARPSIFARALCRFVVADGRADVQVARAMAVAVDVR